MHLLDELARRAGAGARVEAFLDADGRATPRDATPSLDWHHAAARSRAVTLWLGRPALEQRQVRLLELAAAVLDALQGPLDLGAASAEDGGRAGPRGVRGQDGPWVAILDPSGEVVLAGEGARGLLEGLKTPLALAPGERTTTTADGRRVRLTVRPIVGPSELLEVELVIEPESPEARAARTLAALEGPAPPDAGPGTRAPLTAREREVAALAIEGRSNGEIAAALGLGAETVKSHLAAVYRKLGVAGRGELAARVLGGRTP